MGADLDPAGLLADCRATDPVRRRAGYQVLGTLLTRVARTRLGGCGDPDGLAEDCAQEALVAIWRQLDAGRGPDTPAQFLAWSSVIALHKAGDALRRLGHVKGAGKGADPTRDGGAGAPAAGRHKRVPPRLVTSLDAPGAAPHAGANPESSPVDPSALAPEDAAIAGETLARLVAAIAEHPKLSDASRRILVLGFLAELPDDVLAARLGTTRANVHVIRSRNLGKLRGDRALVDALRRLYRD